MAGTRLGRDLAWELPERSSPSSTTPRPGCSTRPTGSEIRAAMSRFVGVRPRRRLAGRAADVLDAVAGKVDAGATAHHRRRGRRRTCSRSRRPSSPRRRPGPRAGAATGAPTSPSHATSGGATSRAGSVDDGRRRGAPDVRVPPAGRRHPPPPARRRARPRRRRRARADGRRRGPHGRRRRHVGGHRARRPAQRRHVRQPRARRRRRPRRRRRAIDAVCGDAASDVEYLVADGDRVGAGRGRRPRDGADPAC